MSGEAPESREGQAPSSPAGAVQPTPSGTNGGAPHASGHVHAHHSALQFRFLEQLKHRNVIRVGILYLVVCWLILDPVHVVFHMLEVPAWANRLVVILMAVGFPAVLLFAWVYEITPEGLRPTVEVDPHRSIRTQTGQRLNRAIFVAMAVALTYFVVDKFWWSKRVTPEQSVSIVVPAAPPTTPPTAVAAKSIAVLPFVDMSEKKDQEYFADGMAEEIIDLLTKVPELHVPARTSSFYFKGKPTKVPDIARELSVVYVLEGSVRKSRNQLRVTAQLVRADNGYHIWSETYDRDLRDVFKVQDDIANAVVQALQITLMGGSLTRQQGGTQNLEAYQFYLRALSAISQNSRTSLEAARGYLDQAIKLDPNFGLAWAWMAYETVAATDAGILLPKDGYERARQLAQHALQLSPQLTEAHTILQYVHRTYDWDWEAADAEGRQVLAVDPSNSNALNFAGLLSATLGHWDDAERQLRLVFVRDPLNTYVHFSLGIALYGAGRFPQAEASFLKVLELAPGYLAGHAYLAKTLLAESKPEAAFAVLWQEADDASRLDFLPITLQTGGRRAEADDALRELITRFAESDAYFVAMTYAYRGDHDLALQWLDRAYKQKDAALVEIVGEPLFKSLANDPRYKAFLRKMKLPQ